MDKFRFDDNECRQYAYYQIGGVTTQDAANQAAVGSAVVGTAIGAAAGAAGAGESSEIPSIWISSWARAEPGLRLSRAASTKYREARPSFEWIIVFDL